MKIQITTLPETKEWSAVCYFDSFAERLTSKEVTRILEQIKIWMNETILEAK